MTTSAEAGLLGASDEEQLAYAIKHQRVIYTNDADYLEFARDGLHHAGLVYSPLKVASIGEVIRFLCFLNETLTPDEMIDRVEYLFVV